MKRSSGPRKTANLSASLNHQLNAYALTAAATGVGLLALSPPAEAKIIYTPANTKVIFQPLPVDLNHDGIADFYLVAEGHSNFDKLWACQYLAVFDSSTGCSSSSRGANAIRTIDSKGRKFGAALRYGEKIQRGEQFAKRNILLGGEVWGSGNDTTWYGPWLNGGKGVKHRYLGLKFTIKGRVHFGWARITVATTSDLWTATLTGYAYETVPGKGIVAGQTKGSEDVEQSNATPVAQAPEPTLGALATGAPGLPIWRRKESSLDGQ
jgi:hypothetical protein